MGWGDSPLMSLPLPLLLLFLSTLWAEDKAQVEPLSLPGLLNVVEEGAGLMKGPTLLRIDSWRTSKAVWICPYPLSDSTQSFTNLEATV